MIEFVYQTALHSGAEQVVVATDDERIAKVITALGGEVFMSTTEHASGTDRLAELATAMAWPDDDIIVNLQGDEPFMPAALLQQVAQGLQQNPRAGIATLCSRIEDSQQLFDPSAVKVVFDKQGFALYFSRSVLPYHRAAFGLEHTATMPSQVPTDIDFWRHLGVYAYRAKVLRDYPSLPPSPLETIEMLEQLRALWNQIAIHVQVASAPPPIGVDTEHDLQAINQWYTHKTSAQSKPI